MSTLRVDAVQERTQGGKVEFMGSTYNKLEELLLAVWNPEEFPVVRLPDTGGTVEPTAPTSGIDGVYITVLYPEGATWQMGAFMLNCEVPDSAAGEVHNVYYSNSGQWWDA